MFGNRIFRIVCLMLSFVLLFFIITFESITQGAYPADKEAIKALESTKYVTVEEKAAYIAFEPEGTFYNKGIIFYPGGNVEAESYAPLMHALSEEGYLCVIVKMPLHLAVLDLDKADNIRKAYPEIADWYMAGHSLGGAMAATYTHDNAAQIRGLILLAAYSTEDLTKDNIQVLSVYGTADEVLNMENYEDYKINLPSDTKEVILDGGNHAYYGNYGEQLGDGTASCSPAEQQAVVAEEICNFLQ